MHFKNIFYVVVCVSDGSGALVIAIPIAIGIAMTKRERTARSRFLERGTPKENLNY